MLHACTFTRIFNRGAYLAAQSVTIKDIANLAGVSIGTVDRVLHNRGRVSADTTKKIRAIVEKTGYTPNLHASNLAQSRICTIGILTPRAEQDSGFWRLPHSGMHRAVEELQPYSIRLSFHCFDRFSESSFKEEAAHLSAENPDGILLAPIMPISVEEIGLALPSGVPLCCFDSDLPGLEKLAFIGQDSVLSGHLAGKLMRLLTADEGSTAIIQAVRADHHIRSRVDGFRTYYPADRQPEVYSEEHLEDPSTCTAFMERLLASEPRLRGIFVTNASGHHVADYLAGVGRTDIGLIGYDLIAENAAHLEKGTIDFLICQRPELQGYRGVVRIFNAFSGRNEGKNREIMPMDILTAENLRFYTPYK